MRRSEVAVAGFVVVEVPVVFVDALEGRRPLCRERDTQSAATAYDGRLARSLALMGMETRKKRATAEHIVARRAAIGGVILGL